MSTPPNPTVPIPGMRVTPDFFGTPQWDLMLRDAWAELCQYLIGQAEARAAFQKETGLNLELLAQCSPIEKLIDEAAGQHKQVMAAWCDWVTVVHWGTAKGASVAVP